MVGFQIQFDGYFIALVISVELGDVETLCFR